LYSQQIAYQEVGIYLTLRYASQGLPQNVREKEDLEQCFFEAFPPSSAATSNEFNQKDNAYFQELIQNQTAMINSLFDLDYSRNEIDSDDDDENDDLSLVFDKQTTRINQQLFLLVDVIERMLDTGITVVESNATRNSEKMR
jgi:hypothetical protein